MTHLARVLSASNRLPETGIIPSEEYLAMSSILASAKHEVATLGWITSDTAMALNRYGVDAASLERRLLDSI